MAKEVKLNKQGAREVIKAMGDANAEMIRAKKSAKTAPKRGKK